MQMQNTAMFKHMDCDIRPTCFRLLGGFFLLDVAALGLQCHSVLQPLLLLKLDVSISFAALCQDSWGSLDLMPIL